MVRPDLELLIDRALDVDTPAAPLASIRVRARRRSAARKGRQLLLGSAAVFALMLPMINCAGGLKAQAAMFRGAAVSGLAPQVQPAPAPSIS
jgi:hypothetical protein